MSTATLRRHREKLKELGSEKKATPKKVEPVATPKEEPKKVVAKKAPTKKASK